MADVTHGAANEQAIEAGRLVGGRFEVEAPDTLSLVGDVYRATDKKTSKRVHLHVIGKDVYATPQEHELLKQAVRIASALSHRNVVATFGMGAESGGLRYVATEFVDGQSLASLVAARLAEGKRFSLRSAYNVVAHVLNALSFAHKMTLHAAITPSAVFVTKAGRVKVGGFGLLTALMPASRARVIGARGEAAFLAPELAKGAAADVRADVFGAGGLLHLLLLGRPPGERTEKVSVERPDLPPDLDELVARVLEGDPAKRPPDATTLKEALRDIVRAVVDAGTEDVDVEIDLESASFPPPPPTPASPAGATRPSGPPPPPPPAQSVAAAGSAEAAPPPAPAAAGPSRAAAPPGGAPKVGDRVSKDESFRPPAGPAIPARTSKVDFDSLLQNIGSQDAERWMVQKDKLDHGPFNARTLIQQILLGQVLEKDTLLNMDTGERRKVKAWPEFKEFVARYKKKKAEEEKQRAIEASGRAEKRGNFAKYLIAAAVVIVVGGGVTIFLLTRQAGRTGPRTPDELADLFQPGQIDIQGTAGILPIPQGGGRRGGGRRGGGGGGRGGGSYDDAMNQAVDLGNVERGGGERQLTANDIARTLNKRLSMFRSCIVREATAMPTTRSCSMDIAIAGTGDVIGVSVTTGSDSFRGCVASKVRSVKFPSFPAPRMGARFGFSW